MFFESGVFGGFQLAINEGGNLFSFANWIVNRHGWWRLNSRNPSAQKLLSHHVTRTKQSILDRSQRQAGNFDYLLIGKVLRMTQDNQLAIGGRKRSHNAFNFHPLLFPLALLFRAETFALDWQIVIIALGSIGKRSFAACVSAQVVDCRVMRNLVDPGRKLKLRPVTGKRSVNLDKNLLS